jgi:hypothetical protein
VILDIIAILWDKIGSHLRKPENQQTNEYLEKIFTDDTFEEYLSTFNTPESQRAIFRIASHLPRNSIPAFSGNCIKQLKQLKSGKSNNAEHLLDCLLSWDFADQVLQLVVEWIAEPFAQENEKSSRRPKKQAKKTKNAEPDTNNVQLGLNLLNSLMVCSIRFYKLTLYSA